MNWILFLDESCTLHIFACTVWCFELTLTLTFSYHVIFRWIVHISYIFMHCMVFWTWLPCDRASDNLTVIRSVVVVVVVVVVVWLLLLLIIATCNRSGANVLFLDELDSIFRWIMHIAYIFMHCMVFWTDPDPDILVPRTAVSHLRHRCQNLKGEKSCQDPPCVLQWIWLGGAIDPSVTARCSTRDTRPRLTWPAVSSERL